MGDPGFRVLPGDQVIRSVRGSPMAGDFDESFTVIAISDDNVAFIVDCDNTFTFPSVGHVYTDELLDYYRISLLPTDEQTAEELKRSGGSHRVAYLRNGRQV